MFEVLSFLISVSASVTYVAGMLRGTFKPERASWIIWTFVSSIGFFSNAALGATGTLWFLGGDTVFVLVVALLSFKYGTGGYSRLDIMMFCIASLGIAAWAVFDAPLLAVGGIIVADIAGVVPTVHKVILNGNDDSLYTFTASAVSALIAVYVADGSDVDQLVLPVYLFFANATIAWSIYYGRARNGQKET